MKQQIQEMKKMVKIIIIQRYRHSYIYNTQAVINANNLNEATRRLVDEYKT